MDVENMADAALAFGGVALVIAIGYLVRRIGVVGPEAERILNRLTLLVGMPGLTFVVLARADPSVFLSTFSLATVAPIVLTMLVTAGALLTRARMRRSTTAVAVLATTTGFTNSGNIGIPLATSILGTTSFLAPSILLQVLVLAPVLMGIATASAHEGAAQPAWRRALRPFATPVVPAAILGAVVMLTGVEIPDAVLMPADLLADASIPMLLLAFGMSLRGARPLEPLRRETTVVLIPLLGKLVLLPLATLGFGLLLGFGGLELLALVVIACLPSAQNMYAIASSYTSVGAVTRTIVLTTTVLACPLAVLAAGLLG
ncbi:AEC family transporter [Agrococcus sp. SGAir0287]|uniref:AEC family transporter n=1 Tax=Agrococcus sp. SGAir0287 TaxID=2070347 RepID=UPI0010CD336A|nr:AEC family transporter [Agrococcus sp. SGAir0287]QCR18176.1 hypothetical protein C1N71_00875 [Agrococcus sp. SGAir0287]